MTRGLVLQAAKQNQACHCGRACRRVGVTASRKIGGAVLRNRARRRMRALARQCLASQATPGYDYALIARRVTPHRDWRDLERDLLLALRRLGLLRP